MDMCRRTANDGIFHRPCIHSFGPGQCHKVHVSERSDVT